MNPILLAVALASSLLATPLATAPSAEAAVGESWSVDVSAIADDDTNVTATGGHLRLARGDAAAAGAAAPSRLGSLVSEPHRLDTPADRFTVSADTTEPPGTAVLVEVRGQSPTEGPWSEWTPPGEPLAAPATVVQVRVTLLGPPPGTRPDTSPGAGPGTTPGTGPTHGTSPGTTGGPGPVVRAVRVTAHPAATATAAAPAAAGPLTFRVFATRVGLVGRTTANGHVITERDHFVALPSRRGLSPRGTGDYTVRVCAANGRCAWAPVWDVGPWNTRDDYWNGPGGRQSWTDLPQGTPQAQAAIQHGYNGGRDQYDRQVRNPAGIDLGDGTFRDALGLPTNSWVTVTYLWTGSGGATIGTVRTTGGPLNVRITPDTTHAPVGLAGNRATVHVQCQVTGQWATGTQGTTDVWLRVSPDRYVSRAHVAAPPTPPCG